MNLAKIDKKIERPAHRGVGAYLTVAALAMSAIAPQSVAAKLNPVQWSLSSDSSEVAPGAKVVLKLNAEVAPGFHLYSLTTPPGGPIRTTLRLEDNPVVQQSSVYQPRPERRKDPTFNIPVELFSGRTTFLIPAALKNDAAEGSQTLTAGVRYQACSDEICLPPADREAATTVVVKTGVMAKSFAIPKDYQLASGASEASHSASPATFGGYGPMSTHLLLLAFTFGLAAVFTPCVFPMVPLTVSYFLNKDPSDRRAVLSQALLFCGGIVILFSAMGFLVTLVAGPFGVVQLSASPWVNGLIAVVFLGIALSLLGAFEITLPSSVLTRLDGASRRGGILGGLLLGLTFCLTSFACIGPFVGTLLASSVQSSGWAPVAGMTAFAIGLATPFFGLALFPSYLKRLPRSGAWLSRVKVVTGFIVLAVMIKYLSTVDQALQLHLLNRERFLAIWFSLFMLAALYLLGQLRLRGSGEEKEAGLGRILSGAALLAFAVSLLPGMFGANLGELESFVPTADVSTAGPSAALTQSGPMWIENDYPGALAIARSEHKPLLVSFSGYACTNCHWMKANLFPRTEVKTALKDFVLLELYTDGTDKASKRNQALEEARFSTIALPFYAILNPDEKILSTRAGLTRSPVDFLSFLRAGSEAENSTPDSVTLSGVWCSEPAGSAREIANVSRHFANSNRSASGPTPRLSMLSITSLKSSLARRMPQSSCHYSTKEDSLDRGKMRIEYKHSFAGRWAHWLNFPLLAVMIWSGLLIYWANDVYRIGVGGFTAFHFFPDSVYNMLHLDHRLAQGMSIHFFFMWLFAINGLAYVLYTLLSGEWRELLPNRSSVSDAIQVTLHDVGLRKDLPPQGKYNAAQRIAYTAILAMGLGSLLTGLSIYKPIQLGWLTASFGGYAMARFLHFWLTMGYLGFFVIHIAQVIRAGWNNFRSMISGFQLAETRGTVKDA